MEVVIAVHLRKETLRGVGKLVAGKDFTDMRNLTTEISKYLSLNTATGNLALLLLASCVCYNLYEVSCYTSVLAWQSDFISFPREYDDC